MNVTAEIHDAPEYSRRNIQDYTTIDSPTSLDNSQMEVILGSTSESSFDEDEIPDLEKSIKKLILMKIWLIGSYTMDRILSVCFQRVQSHTHEKQSCRGI